MSSIEEDLSRVPRGRTLDGTQAESDDTAPRRLPPDPTPSHRLRLVAILRAASVIDPVFTETPQFEAAGLGEALGISTLVTIAEGAGTVGIELAEMRMDTVVLDSEEIMRCHSASPRHRS